MNPRSDRRPARTPVEPAGCDCGARTPQVGSNDTKLTDSRPHGPLGWLYDPEHARFQAALRVRCPVCLAPAGRRCHNPIDPATPIPGGRLLHYGRTGGS